jgi:uncharacterized integral membrane protein
MPADDPMIMIRRIATTLVLAALAILLIAFAVANRQAVIVAFDPFDPAHPAYALALPLYALLLAAVIVGVIIGGIAAWLRQRKWRRAARLAQARAGALDTELKESRRRMEMAGGSAKPAPRWQPQLTIPPPAA